MDGMRIKHNNIYTAFHLPESYNIQKHIHIHTFRRVSYRLKHAEEKIYIST